MRYMSATSTGGVLYKISVLFDESFQHTDPGPTRLSDTGVNFWTRGSLTMFILEKRGLNTSNLSRILS